MSNDDNIINKIIRDNFKLTENDNKNYEIKEEINDKSFNKLLNLQLLIQKYSGLKELCKLTNIILFLNYSYKRKR